MTDTPAASIARVLARVKTLTPDEILAFARAFEHPAGWADARAAALPIAGTNRAPRHIAARKALLAAFPVPPDRFAALTARFALTDTMNAVLARADLTPAQFDALTAHTAHILGRIWEAPA